MQRIDPAIVWSSWDVLEYEGQVGFHGRMGQISVGDVHEDVDVWHWRLDPLFAEYVEPAQGLAQSCEAAKACVEEALREWLRLSGLKPARQSQS
jgi:hypothetical protein